MFSSSRSGSNNSPRRRAGERGPSAKRAGLALVAFSLTAAAACSPVGDDDPAAGLDSETTVGADATVGDTGTGSGHEFADGGADTPTNSDETRDSGSSSVSTITPSATFQRLPGSMFGNASEELIIEDAVLFDEDRWLFAGGLEDGRQRSSRATVSLVSVDDPRAGRRVPLPDDDADRSTANGLVSGDDGVVIGGSVESGDRTSAVLWTADRSLDRWRILELPTDPSDNQTTALHLVQGDTGRYAIGRTGAEGLGQPLAWREIGGVWQPLEVSGIVGLDVTAFGAAVGRDGLVMVGRSSAALGDPEPRVWTERDGRLLLTGGQGLPPGGSLYDVVVGDDGTIIAVGASTEDGISTPTLATSSDGGQTWTTNSAMPDLAGWVSFGGVEFARLLVDGDDLYTALSNPVVQQLLRSSDGGASWQRVGNLSLAGDNFVPANALAKADDGTILVAGADVAMTWSDGGWSTIVDDALPRQLGALQAADVVAVASGFVIGGGRTARVGDELGFEAMLWQSPDGSRWGRPPVDQPSGFIINNVFDAGDGVAAAFKAGGSYFTPVHLVRPDASGRWQSSLLPVGEAFLDHAIEGVAGSIVAAGTRPRSDLSKTDPLFVVVEPDGELREVPLTNSPVKADANGAVICLAGAVGAMLAVLEWGDGEIGIAVSTNGERWRGLEIGDEVKDLSLPACHSDGDRFVLAGREATGRAVVARSGDGQSWIVDVLGDPALGDPALGGPGLRGDASILGIDSIDGQLFLSGWMTSENRLGRDATIWRPSGQTWEPLPNNGLEGDTFSRQTELTGLAVSDGIVVAIGSDRGRAGAWIATVEALGL